MLFFGGVRFRYTWLVVSMIDLFLGLLRTGCSDGKAVLSLARSSCARSERDGELSLVVGGNRAYF